MEAYALSRITVFYEEWLVMVNFSWRQWLRGTCGSLSERKRRRPAVQQVGGIEGLEDRALLTANLPVAVDDSAYVVNEDTTLNGTTVLANDTDADGDTIDQAIIGATTTHGALTLNLDGTFSYTPLANFHGTDSFTYFAKDSAHDESSVNPATVTITVNSVNDAPVANAVTFTTNEDTALANTLTGSDVDSDPLTFAVGAVAPAHGSVIINTDGTFTYTPTANYHGADSFSFKVNDGTTDSAEATVAITVNPINDAPVANADSFTINENTALANSLTGSDVDGDLFVAVYFR
jgi:VCBS repeat-containing protein